MRYVTLESIEYFWFALNTPGGSGAGATDDDTGTGTGTGTGTNDYSTDPDVTVREGGLGASASPTYTGFAMRLNESVGYPAGAYEVAVPVVAAHGFAVDKTYGVFCSALVSGVNPTGFVGEFRTSPPSSLDAAKGTKFSRAVDGIVTGTASTGSSATSVTSSACSPAGGTLDQFKGRAMVFDANTTTAGLRGATAAVTGCTASATPTFTVSPALPATPASGDTFTLN